MSGKANQAKCALSSSLSEPCSRFISLAFVTESCPKDFFFLACSINLQWNNRDEEPERARLVDVEKDPRDPQTSENVDGVANSRIKAVGYEGLSLRAHGEGAT